MDVKEGYKTTELKIAVAGIVTVILMFMVAVGSISQSEVDTLAPAITAGVLAIMAAAPVVVGWIATVYTNARRDVKTSANVSKTNMAG